MTGIVALGGLFTLGALGIALARVELGRWPFTRPKSRPFASSVSEPPHSFDVPIYATDAEGSITHWNEAAARLLGRQAPDVIGRDARTLLPLETRAEESAAIARIAGGVGVQQLTGARLAADGHVVHVEVTLMPLAGPDGRARGATFILHATA